MENEKEEPKKEQEKEEAKENSKIKGTAAWFAEDKGYGFIIGEDTKEYFCHFSQIQMEGFKTLYEGEKVEFEPAKDEQGRDKATNVVKIVKK